MNNLYQITCFDVESVYVLAPSMVDALEKWEKRLRENGMHYEEPECIVCLCPEEDLIR